MGHLLINLRFDGNKILNTTPVSGRGNTAIYVALYGSTPCGPV